MQTTAGQLAINEILPPDLQDHARRLDDKGTRALLQQVQEKYPEKYRDIAHELMRIGHRSADLTGGHSFDLKHLRPARAALQAQAEIKTAVQQIHANPSLSPQQKEDNIVEMLQNRQAPLADAIYQESLAENNPLARQVESGARGNRMQLKSLRGPDLLYVDHKDRPIPIPVLRTYSQGLRPVEYYAGTFGARKGLQDTKFAVQDSGFMAKQMNQVAHHLMVTQHDAVDTAARENTGLPVDTHDPDNAGALLAGNFGGYKRNTVLTPKILSDLHHRGIGRLLVRSPMVGGPPDGGVYARDVGVRERGGIAPLGDFVGIAAAQALSEPLTQAQLSSKHSGGVAGATHGGVSGFKLVNQLFQVPKVFKGGAAHAQVDGKVQSLEPAPQGGTYAHIGGQRHYIGTGYAPWIKSGDTVEAGDVISEGIPNPAEIVEHKGIGEGRRYFTHALRNAYHDAKMPHDRRNIELLARGLIDHVRMTEEYGEHIPDDIVPYSQLEHHWQPRKGHEMREPDKAKDMYLEQPVLHYSIGTKIRPSVQKELANFGVKKVTVHKEPPPFVPEMIRGMENISHQPDWMTRMLGSYQKKNLLAGVHRGDVSDEAGTSYVPSLARSIDFGRVGPLATPKLGS